MATSRRRKPTTGDQPKVEGTPEASAQAEAPAPEGDAAQPQTPEEVQAELERLRAELAAVKSSNNNRRPRVRRMTPKQRKLYEIIRDHPETDIGSACEQAGATATSHGFVFRMIENGYLRLVPVPEEELPMAAAPTSEEGGEAAPTPAPEEGEAAAPTPEEPKGEGDES